MPDTISTDGPDVLAATPDTVILRGRHHAEPEPIDCVVHVTRDLYFSAVTAWLDPKGHLLRDLSGFLRGSGRSILRD
jgi:hypothetical protein